ncbi:uncharacterized protein LOC124134907 [Haliotis rufescens]|uniref:uncharacterized protein LOC124134907 n=1 Tax=Haliotis rufescens TaxID=6454 RepID=UPI00201EC6C1|nr:uncharacterized protein LOC124134907 [Haliotis rufescens]
MSWKRKKVQESIDGSRVPGESGHWRATTLLDVHRDYQCKWAVVDVETRKVKRWEECANRFISSNCELLSIRAHWNTPFSTLTHSAIILVETLDMAKFYDVAENWDDLVTSEMSHVVSSWQSRQETNIKPFVMTETEKKAALKPRKQKEQRPRSHR